MAPRGTLNEAPVMDAGCGATVTVLVAGVPQGVAYEIVAVPAAIPVTTPVSESTIAVSVSEVDQVPPVVEFVNVVVAPSQTETTPVGEMVPGTPTIVTGKVAAAQVPT